MPACGGEPAREQPRVHQREGHRRRGEHDELSRFDAEVEAEEWDSNPLHEQCLEVRREARPVHEPEHPGEHRSIAAAPRRAGPVAHQDVLDPRDHDRHRDQKLHERRRKVDRAGDGERERDGVTHREGGHHPEHVAQVAEPVDRGERDQEEHVVERFHVEDVAHAELREGEQLAHWSLQSGTDWVTPPTGERIYGRPPSLCPPVRYPPTMTRRERIFGGVASVTLNVKVAGPSFEVLAATFTAPSASSHIAVGVSRPSRPCICWRRATRCSAGVPSVGSNRSAITWTRAVLSPALIVEKRSRSSAATAAGGSFAPTGAAAGASVARPRTVGKPSTGAIASRIIGAGASAEFVAMMISIPARGRRSNRKKCTRSEPARATGAVGSNRSPRAFSGSRRSPSNSAR